MEGVAGLLRGIYSDIYRIAMFGGRRGMAFFFLLRVYSHPEVDRIWRGVYYTKNPIHPRIYLLKGAIP